MSEIERHSSFPRVGMHAVYERVLALRLRLRSQTSLARLSPPPPPQSFRDPARLEPWFCFDAVGRTRPDACLPGGVFGFWPLMPAAVFDFLTCRGGGGVSVFFLFFSRLCCFPPRRGVAWRVEWLSPPLFLPQHPHRLPHRVPPTPVQISVHDRGCTPLAPTRPTRPPWNEQNSDPPPRSSAPLFPPSRWCRLLPRAACVRVRLRLRLLPPGLPSSLGSHPRR